MYNFQNFFIKLKFVLDHHYMYFIVLYHVYIMLLYSIIFSYCHIHIMNLYHDHDCWLLQEIVTRLGRWIDFENDYKTMYPTFMESIWWVFKELYNRGLVYKGSKVMPFSTACNTPLSNFESGQNYKDVVDPAGVTTFILINRQTLIFSNKHI